MLRKLKEFKLPEVEEKVLKFWKENQIFEKSLKIREGGKQYNFLRVRRLPMASRAFIILKAGRLKM